MVMDRAAPPGGNGIAGGGGGGGGSGMGGGATLTGAGAHAATVVMKMMAASFLTPRRIFRVSDYLSMSPTGFYTERKALFDQFPKKMAQWFPTGPFLSIQAEPLMTIRGYQGSSAETGTC
jgi:hypothetical protein